MNQIDSWGYIKKESLAHLKALVQKNLMQILKQKNYRNRELFLTEINGIPTTTVTPTGDSVQLLM